MAGREKAAQEVNSVLVQTYWEIGRYNPERFYLLPVFKYLLQKGILI